MRVVLLRDVPKLGKKNEVKEVSDGYARNFLFAQNLAKPATAEALKSLAKQQQQEEKEKTEELQKYEDAVDKLKSLTLNFKVKIGQKGRAFGSVTAAEIQEALAKQDIRVERDWLALEDHIKTTGEHQVEIRFPHGITGKMKVVIEAE